MSCPFKENDIRWNDAGLKYVEKMREIHGYAPFIVPLTEQPKEFIEDYDCCVAFKIECVGEDKCPIVKK